MFHNTHRARLQIEHLDDRCLPSSLVGTPVVFPSDAGGPQAVQVASRNDSPAAPTASRHEDTQSRVLRTQLAFQCSGDISSMKASAVGSATHVGDWSGEGKFDKVNINLAADRGMATGSLTIVTANGDKIFVSFAASWRLSTGKGHELIRVTGGTGRFAGASGFAFTNCTIYSDPASPTTLRCNCTGTGVLLLARR